MKASVYIATSLDGFIARENGDLDWLPGTAESGESMADHGQDYGYQDFMATVDFLVMGRNSFDKVLTFGEWPYGNTPVIVLSRTLTTLPSHLPPTVELNASSPTELIQQLAARGAKHLYIDGGQLIQSFLREGLIQELIITRIPVLLGRGLPLFGQLPADIKLHHLTTQAYPTGLVQSHYQVLG